MDALTIRIASSSNDDGYVFDIYDHDHTLCRSDCDSYDGGLCTTNMVNALALATEPTQFLIRHKNGEECIGCRVDLNTTGSRPSKFHSSRYGCVCPKCRKREEDDGDFIDAR